MSGQLKGRRSSRLSQAWRVLYQIDREQVTVSLKGFRIMTTARGLRPRETAREAHPGKSLQLLRELQELTQSELARRTGIAQSNISAFESGSQEMGLKRVKVLAEALGVHPAVIAFPDYDGPPAPRRSKSETRRAVKVA